MEEEKELKLTLDSSFDEAYHAFLVNYFQKEVVEKLLEAQKSKLEYQQIEDFLNSQLVKDRFVEEWGRVSEKGKQLNINPKIALLETIDQTFGNIIFAIDFHLGGFQRSPDLESFTEEELKQIKEKALFTRQLKDLYRYATQQL